MSEIPLRLLVISARVPEGDSCTGCDLALTVGRWVSETEKVELQLCPLHKTDGKPTVTHGIRLPACRERDGWAAYPPGSGVPELVEAAKNLDDAYNDDDQTRSRENAIDEVVSRAFDVGETARKVAGVSDT